MWLPYRTLIRRPNRSPASLPGTKPESQFARSLAENGFEVVVPVLDPPNLALVRPPGHPDDQFPTNHTASGFIARRFTWAGTSSATKCKRCLPQSTGSAQENANGRIGVAGYGEGGLIAFYSAAVDSAHRVSTRQRLLRFAAGGLV